VALSLLLVPPLIGGVLLLLVLRGAPARLCGAVAALAAALSLVGAVLVSTGRPRIDTAWVPSLGLRWSFAVDGIAIPLILLTAALTLLVVLHSRGVEPPGGTPATFYGAILLTSFGALATFTVRDAIGFYIAFELVLVPMWVLIGRFGDEHAPAAVRTDAANRFLLFTVTGSAFLLVGLILLVTLTGTSNLDQLAAAAGSSLSHGQQVLLAVLLVAGMAIKVPLWPVHTWLPPAHSTAPTAGSVLLAAILLKMGTYGLVRVAIPVVPDGFATIAPYLAVLAVVGIIWAGLACLVERDLKRLVAYSSVAHMGFVVLGLSSGTQTGMQAALFGNIAHGVVSGLLFMVVGRLKSQWHTADLESVPRALRELSPRYGFALVVGFAAALGLPGLIGFWGEVLSVYSAWTAAASRPSGLFQVCAVVAAIGMALAAGYSLRVLRQVWAGEATSTEGSAADPARDVSGVEWAVVAAMVAAIVLGGLLPAPVLATTGDDVARLLTASSTAGGMP
jgi:NADH-quinone oxidoreductase subunit M